VETLTLRQAREGGSVRKRLGEGIEGKRLAALAPRGSVAPTRGRRRRDSEEGWERAFEGSALKGSALKGRAAPRRTRGSDVAPARDT
jgi:hypothetical protein